MQFTKKANADDKLANNKPNQVSLSALSYLLSEYTRKFFYNGSKSVSVVEFNEKLKNLGYGVGMRMLESIAVHDKDFHRFETKEDVMAFIISIFWKTAFGYQIEYGKVKAKPNEFLITDKNLIIEKYLENTVHTKNDGSEVKVNYMAFVAGMVQACLDGADFVCL